MKVALVQFKASTDKKKNLKKILDYISLAAKKGAQLVAFPEFMMFYTTSNQSSNQLSDQAETDRKSTRLNSSHVKRSRMPSSA